MNKMIKDIFDGETCVEELKWKDFEYDKKNKKLFVKKENVINKKGFIVFYAPWCKYSLKFADLFIELAIEHHQYFYFGSVNIEDIDNDNDLLQSAAFVMGFPTLKIITTENEIINYEFEYTRDNLNYFISMS